MGKYPGLLVSVLLLSQTSLASPSFDEACSDPAVRKIEIPGDSGYSGSVSYRFKVLGDLNSPHPVVIYIPGGPGGTSINDSRKGIPEDLPLIQTDPRGAGCNADMVKDWSHLSSKDISNDVLEMIRSLKLKKYILYGVSFGTVIATQVAGDAEALGLPQPTAVVLEGIVGRRGSLQERIEMIRGNWDRVVTPHQEETDIKAWDPFDLFEVGMSAMAIGNLPSARLVGATLFKQIMETYGNESVDNKLNRILREIWPGTTLPASKEVFTSIWCNEIFDYEPKYALEFDSDGKPEIAHPKCLPTKLQPYDAKQWQIRSPLFYFAGGWDGQTPFDQARYHFDAQVSSKGKAMVHVLEGGHKPLQINLMDCRSQIWKSISGLSPIPLEQSIESCAAPLRLLQ